MKASGNNLEEIGARMKQARIFLGLTQEGLALAVGGSKRGIQDNEARNRVPGGEVIAGFIGLGINPVWLLTGEGEMLLSDNQARPALSDKPNESKDEELLQARHELEAQEHVIDLPILRTAITLTEESSAVQALSIDQRAELILNFYTRLSRHPAK